MKALRASTDDFRATQDYKPKRPDLFEEIQSNYSDYQLDSEAEDVTWIQIPRMPSFMSIALKCVQQHLADTLEAGTATFHEVVAAAIWHGHSRLYADENVKAFDELKSFIEKANSGDSVLIDMANEFHSFFSLNLAGSISSPRRVNSRCRTKTKSVCSNIAATLGVHIADVAVLSCCHSVRMCGIVHPDHAKAAGEILDRFLLAVKARRRMLGALADVIRESQAEPPNPPQSRSHILGPNDSASHGVQSHDSKTRDSGSHNLVEMTPRVMRVMGA
jgi:hypothetical protein